MNPRSEVFLSIVAYSLCSGTLVLLNKHTLQYLPYPSLIVSFQLAATLAFIGVGNFSGYLRVDPIKWKYVKPYLYYVVAFAIGTYANMRSLSMSKVETIIVFRALSPMIVAVLDKIYLGREYPSRQSWFALFLLVVGAYRYAHHNDEALHSQTAHAYLVSPGRQSY